MSSSIQDEKYWTTRPINDEQRDWNYGKDNWIEDYKASKDHPHRQVIIDELKNFDWESLGEIGCNTGPNLELIAENFSDKTLAGLDPSLDTLKNTTAKAYYLHGIAQYLPWRSKSLDVILADASLMYVPPEDINQAMDEIDRVVKKAVIIVERFDESELGTDNGHIWARNYTKLLQDRGFEVKEINMTEDLWPTSKNWQLHGRYFVAVRPSPTSTPN